MKTTTKPFTAFALLATAALLLSTPHAQAAVITDPALASGAGSFNGGGGNLTINLSASGSTAFGTLEALGGFAVVRSFSGFENHATAAAGTLNTIAFTDPSRPDVRFSFGGTSINASTGSEMTNVGFLASSSGVRLYPGGAEGVNLTTIQFGAYDGSDFILNTGVSAVGFVLGATGNEFDKNRIVSITTTFLSIAGDALSTQTIDGSLLVSPSKGLYFGYQSGGAAIGSVEIAIEVTAQSGQVVNLALSNLGFAPIPEPAHASLLTGFGIAAGVVFLRSRNRSR